MGLPDRRGGPHAESRKKLALVGDAQLPILEHPQQGAEVHGHDAHADYERRAIGPDIHDVSHT